MLALLGRLRDARRRPLLLVPTCVVALTLAGCGSETGTTTGTTTASARQGVDATVRAPAVQESELQLPRPEAWDGTDVVGEDAGVQLATADGVRVAVWIDPDDERRVLLQESAPASEGWSEPVELARSGDGCLLLRAATDGTLVAATLYCYESDAFIEQAPDQAYGVVRTATGEWEVREYLELTGTPQLEDGTVVWSEDMTWSAEDGFEEIPFP